MNVNISKIVEYCYNYAEFLVSDGIREVICISNDVPLPNNQEPQVGMPVKVLYVFTRYDPIEIFVAEERKYYIKKSDKGYFDYDICGSIYDRAKSLIKVFDFIISLEYEYPDGIDFLMEGEFVEFHVDRFDCDLDL